jgi:hypothetical protein
MSLGGERLLVKEKNLKNRQVTAIKDIDPETYSDYQSAYSSTPISFERLTASCLLHDFLKCSGQEADHDADLIKTFPDLCVETYSHAKPKDHKHPLLIGDVLELRRFDDHASWYDPKVVEADLDVEQREIVGHFYRCVRPALLFAFQHRDQPWVAHGPEVEMDLKSPRYPQHPVSWVAVEIDRVPFNHCFVHDQSLPAPWGRLRGAIPISKLKERGDVKPHMEFYRDHLFATADTTKNDWMFVTNKQSTAKQPWLEPTIQSLVKDGHMLIELNVLNKFLHVAQVIRDRILILGCANLNDALYL